MTSKFVRAVSLRDGRRLAYREYGDPDGLPCIYTPGWPASALLGKIYHKTARGNGIRWISVDKPGIAHSDYDPQQSLPRYAGDIGQLADQLGLDRFAVVGESGGAPFALAVAHGLAGRPTVTLLLGGMGPVEDEKVRNSMTPQSRRLLTIARRTPWVVSLQLRSLRRTVNDGIKGRRWVESLRDSGPEADRRALDKFDHELLLPATAEALQDGGEGALQELAMVARPWGFTLAEVSGPIEVWHGTEDANVPVAVARRVVEAIPGCRSRIVEGEGHSIGAVLSDHLMATIRRAAGA
jgi:pimeloyl-ACP methyl ester carboxylesterase